MRKVLVAVVSVALMAGLASGASAGVKGKKQEVSGTILSPLIFPLDMNTCYAGVHRRIAIVSGEQVNGDVGYHFDLDPGTAGKNFVLEVTGGQGTPDIDIIFYTKFGTMDDVINDPGGAGAPATVGFENRGAGGESGKVPDKAYTKAIVCGFAGSPAAAIGFTYTAGKGVKLPKE